MQFRNTWLCSLLLSLSLVACAPAADNDLEETDAGNGGRANEL